MSLDTTVFTGFSVIKPFILFSNYIYMEEEMYAEEAYQEQMEEERAEHEHNIQCEGEAEAQYNLEMQEQQLQGEVEWICCESL